MSTRIPQMTFDDDSAIEDGSSTSEGASCSTPLCHSTGYCRTISKTLSFSEQSVSEDYEEKEEGEKEMMKERFSKLLLGEDMSGCGKGVSSAVAISNAITNLYATVFGQFLRLEPLRIEKKAMWRREMECLLSICDHIVDLVDGSSLKGEQEMVSSPRRDIYINLPALEQLDDMLLAILESFTEQATEFWYVDDADRSPTANISRSLRRTVKKDGEKWWRPIPCLPSYGLTAESRRELRRKRDCANQIHKAATAINAAVLSDMHVPESYFVTLRKSGRAGIGDTAYRYLSTAEQFTAEHLLDGLSISTDHEAMEAADRFEASMYVWQRKADSGGRSSGSSGRQPSDSDMNDVLASRAHSVLLSLKQRFPALSQTTLDAMKIQYNKDVGQAILESYSRVLEGFAFNIVSYIDDVLSIDDSIKKR